MSNALAIASVTRVLQDLLNNGLIDHDVTGAIGGNVTVSALPPDRILGQPGTPENSQLNLFLHQVSPNQGWRNADLPTRDANGALVSNPLLALDLHYLLTAYGAEELHSEILLGYAMQLLHETPVLSREAVRSALAAPAVNGTILPPAFQATAASELADQVELIRITPDSLATDDMSKLWTAFQSHYRPTAAYQVSVVLIESRRPKRTPLPVLTRGRPDLATGRDAGVAVQASMLPPFPTLESLELENQQIAARLGERVVAHGHHLAGDQVFLRFAEARSGRVLQLPVTASATDRRAAVDLPPDPPAGPVSPDSPDNPDNWRAGLYQVTALVQQGGEPDHVSNELPMMLAPRLLTIGASLASGICTFTATCSPRVADTQRVVLIVGDREIPADPFAGPLSDTLTFQSGGFQSGTAFWVRLRVDRVDSILIDRAVKPPAFVPSQQVAIP